jgi:hypothetical protein
MGMKGDDEPRINQVPAHLTAKSSAKTNTLIAQGFDLTTWLATNLPSNDERTRRVREHKQQLRTIGRETVVQVSLAASHRAALPTHSARITIPLGGQNTSSLSIDAL